MLRAIGADGFPSFRQKGQSRRLNIWRKAPEAVVTLKGQALRLQQALELRVSVGHREQIRETAFGCCPISDGTSSGGRHPGGSGEMNGPARLGVSVRGLGTDRFGICGKEERAPPAFIRGQTACTTAKPVVVV